MSSTLSSQSGRRGFAEAGMRRRDQPAPVGEKGVDRMPRIEATGAVEHQKGRTGTDLSELKIDTGDCNHTARHKYRALRSTVVSAPMRS